jgi:hypothetical protein
MRIPRFLLPCLLSAVLAGHTANRSMGWIGPMLHWNYGDHGSRFGIGLEGSHWFAGKGLPMGVDFGLEWETSGKFRLYSEGELSLFIAGLGCGPVLEWGGEGFRWGLQSTMFMNYGGGVDFRWREMGTREEIHAGGAFFKYPLYGYDGPASP